MPSLSEARSSGAARPLSAAEQQELLHYARAAMVQAVCCGDLPRVLRHDGIFAERCGVFVTLHMLQRLRGCIGVVDTQESLGSSLVRCAAGAALADPRFPPVHQEELSALHIEISLLSTPEPIRPEKIQLGRHGLLVTSGVSPTPFAFKGGASVKRGLLLPQVAIEHHFTVEQFLAETCRKAGLPPDAWRLAATADAVANSSQSLTTDRHAIADPPVRADDPATHPADDSYQQPNSIQLFAFTCQVFSEAETGSPQS
jgi:uncharacterized protein